MNQRRALLTRPKGASEALAADLAAEGITADIWPLTKIRFLPLAAEARRAAAYAFTSANGVKAASYANLRPGPAYCVGPQTARAAKEAGFAPVAHADGGAEALIALCRAEAGKLAAGILHIRGEEARIDLGAELSEAGLSAQSAVAYRAERTEEAPKEIIQRVIAGKYAIYAFYSPRNAAIFSEIAESHWRQGLGQGVAIAISDRAAQPLKDLGFADLRVAERPNGAEMYAAICAAG